MQRREAIGVLAISSTQLPLFASINKQEAISNSI